MTSPTSSPPTSFATSTRVDTGLVAATASDDSSSAAADLAWAEVTDTNSTPAPSRSASAVAISIASTSGSSVSTGIVTVVHRQLLAELSTPSVRR
jgi:hypothetical protein